MGISPDIIVLRCDEPIEESIFQKIALFCNVRRDCVLENITLPNLYEAPVMLEEQNFSSIVCRELGLDVPAPDLSGWKAMLEAMEGAHDEVTIAIVGKYVQLHDAYLSLSEALRHAGYALGAHVKLCWVDSEGVTAENVATVLAGCQGVVVPGGFGSRGIAGMIEAARYCRETGLPYLGICLGMQIAVIEFARDVCALAGANSGEFDPAAAHKVIDFLPDQSEEADKGGTLRLGAYPCHLADGTVIRRCYGRADISERHRHRYEFNNEYRTVLQEHGLVLGGTSPDGSIVETVEVPDHRFYVGVQFHPEFKSRPNRAHPLFLGLVAAAKEG